VRDLETILETLGDYAGRTKDLEVWTEYVRNALARTICKQYLDPDEKMWCVTLDPALEELISGHVQRSEAGGTTNTMPPRTQQQVVERIAAKVNEVAGMGKTAVVLCSPHIRAVVRRMIEGPLASTAVLGLNEIVPEVNAEAVALVGVSG
jgi:flagellar biosynthesis protein FlhA